MDLKDNFLELRIKHEVLGYIYQFMDIRYSGIVFDARRYNNKLHIFVTLPNVANGISGEFSIPLKVIKETELGIIVDSIKSYIDEILEGLEEGIKDDDD